MVSHRFATQAVLPGALDSVRQAELAANSAVEFNWTDAVLGFLRLHLYIFGRVKLSENDVLDGPFFATRKLDQLIDSIPADQECATLLEIHSKAPNLDDAYWQRFLDSTGFEVRKYFASVLQDEQIRRQVYDGLPGFKPSDIHGPNLVFERFSQLGVPDDTISNLAMSMDRLKRGVRHKQIRVIQGNFKPSFNKRVLENNRDQLCAFASYPESQYFLKYVIDYILSHEILFRSEIHDRYWRIQGSCSPKCQSEMKRVLRWYDHHLYSNMAAAFGACFAPADFSGSRVTLIQKAGERIVLGPSDNTMPRDFGIDLPVSALAAIGNVPAARVASLIEDQATILQRWRSNRDFGALRESIEEFIRVTLHTWDWKSTYPNGLIHSDHNLHIGSAVGGFVGAGIGGLVALKGGAAATVLGAAIGGMCGNSAGAVLDDRFPTAAKQPFSAAPIMARRIVQYAAHVTN